MAIEITKATNDELLADHYRRHWLDMGIAQTEVVPSWRDSTLRFIGARAS
jgi:hypothetical protein